MNNSGKTGFRRKGDNCNMKNQKRDLHTENQTDAKNKRINYSPALIINYSFLIIHFFGPVPVQKIARFF